MVDILSLQEAADTYVGNAMVRGCSGGQRRRVTLGEALLMHARLLALDSVTSGLDAATAFSTVRWICELARRTGCAAIVALQQPTVEVFGLFADVILLAEGAEIYCGPVLQLDGYLQSLGYVRPSYMDLADFASEVVGDPVRAAELSMRDRRDRLAAAGHGRSNVATENRYAAAVPAEVSEEEEEHNHLEEAQVTALDGFPLVRHVSIQALCAAWRSSPAGASAMLEAGGGDQETPPPPQGTAVTSAVVAVQEVATPSVDAGAAGAQPLFQLDANVAPSPLHAVPLPGPTAPGSFDLADQHQLPPPASSVPVADDAADDVNAYVRKLPCDPSASAGVMLGSLAAKTRYGFGNQPSFPQQTWLCLERQCKLNYRNVGFIGARWLNALLMGLILSTLAILPPFTSYQIRFGVITFSLIFIGFSNNAEIPITLASRPVVYKQTGASFYSSGAWIAGVIVASLPIAVGSVLIFGSLVYWITGFTPLFTNFLVFLLILFIVDLLMASVFRLMILCGSNQDRATAVGFAFIAVALQCSGFFILHDQMPSWLAWLVWISPFWWAVTALANNEFQSARYQVPVAGGAAGGELLGAELMNTFGYPYSRLAQWMAVVFILVLWVAVGWLAAPAALDAFRFDKPPGTARRSASALATAEAEGPAAGAASAAAAAAETPQATAVRVLPACGGEEGLFAAGAAVTSMLSSAGRRRRRGLGGGGGAHEAAQEDHEAAAALQDAGVALPSATPRGGALPAPAPAAAALSSSAAGMGATTSAAGMGATTSAAGMGATTSAAGMGATTTTGSGDFPKVALAFRDVRYYVKTRGGVQRALLQGVSGFALPYTTTALMGASGAGKTTLLDVLAMRKTTGTVAGAIALNGAPASRALAAALVGFAEQHDVHTPTATVQEALAFSAALRMPRHHHHQALPTDAAAGGDGNAGASADAAPPDGDEAAAATDRAARVAGAVESTLHMLELDRLRGRLVGSLSRSELKRLTIGVEVAAQPPVLFCDEPTSFLAANGAAAVMRALRRIAATGRTVVCTIHQPSADVFFAFDRLLLLGAGGRPLYFGRIGPHARALVRYLQGADASVPRLPPATNPATWMLAVAGGLGTADGGGGGGIIGGPGDRRGESTPASSGPEERRTGGGEAAPLSSGGGPPLSSGGVPEEERGAAEAAAVAAVTAAPDRGGQPLPGLAAALAVTPKPSRASMAPAPGQADHALQPSASPSASDAADAADQLDSVATAASKLLCEAYLRSTLRGSHEPQISALLGMADTAASGISNPSVSAESSAVAGDSTRVAAVAAAEAGTSAAVADAAGTSVAAAAHSRGGRAPIVVRLAESQATTHRESQATTHREGTESQAVAEATTHRGIVARFCAGLFCGTCRRPTTLLNPSTVVAGSGAVPSSSNGADRDNAGLPEAGGLSSPAPSPAPSPAYVLTRLDDTGSSGSGVQWKQSALLGTQFWLVLKRGSLDYWRSAEFQLTRILVMLFLAVMFGLLFINIDLETYAGTRSGFGLFLASVTYAAILFFTTSITLRFTRREVFYRERAAGFYAPEAYFASSMLTDMPWLFVVVLTSLSITYWMVGLRASAAAFFFTYLAGVILATFFLATAVAYAALFPTLPVAQIFGGLTFSVMFLFAGLFIPESTMPPFWTGLYYAVPTSHILRAISMEQYYCAGGAAAGCPQITVVEGGVPVQVDRFAYAEGYLGTSYDARWGQLGWASVAIAVMLVAAAVAIRFVNHEQR